MVITNCVDEDHALAFAAGHLRREARALLDRHIDRCKACRRLVVEAIETVNPKQVVQLGVRIVRRYRPTRVLGVGGTSLVYDAHDEWTDRQVALKVPFLGHEAKQQLQREFRLGSRVVHPNVCKMLEHYSAALGYRNEPLPFVAMELLKGRTLGQQVRQRRFSPSAVGRVARQLLLGLQAIHEAGVVHGDFKSDNVVFRERVATSDAVITDFGLAQLLSNRARARRILSGSSAYVAPEQVVGATPSRQVDIYGFGIVLFEMLTGTLPFAAATPISAVLLRLRQMAPLPSKRVPKLSPRWDRVVRGCLAHNPRERFDSAKQVLDELDGI